MKSNQLLACIISLSGFLTVNGQNNFDLNKLKFRYQSYKGLQFGTSLYQKGESRNNSLLENADNTFQFDGNLNYFLFVNSDKKQITTSAGLEFQPSYKSTSSFLIPGLTANIRFNTINKIYHKHNNFLGYKFNINDNYYAQKKSINAKPKVLVTDMRQFNNNTEGYFILGKGRAEYISDGINALRLMTELTSKKLLLREATEEDITSLTNIIIHYNNTRVLDNRLNKIAMIEAMINSLKTGQLIKDCDASTFAILIDQIYFAPYFSRFTGNVKQLEVGAQMTNLVMRLKTDSNAQNNDALNITPKIAYSWNKFRALDVKHQMNMGADIGVLDLISNSYNIATRRTRTPQVMLSGYYERGYYPNTRTYLTWTNRLSINAGNVYSPKTFQKTSLGQIATSSISIYYYFSPQLRLSIDETLNCTFTQDFYDIHNSYANSKVRNYLYASFNYALY